MSLFRKENAEKKTKKTGGCLKFILIVFSVFFILAVIGTLGNNSTSKKTHIYDNAKTKVVMNGSRTESIGEYSIITIDSSDVTDENLEDWYFNYVEKNNFNWCMILYKDKNDNSGIYSVKGMVEKDVIFIKDSYGDYALGNSKNSIFYCPSDNKLKKME